MLETHPRRVVEGSCNVQVIPQLGEQGFTGTATECLAKLGVIAGRTRPVTAAGRPRPGICPASWGRLVPSRSDAGIVVEFTRTGATASGTSASERRSNPRAAVTSVLRFA